MASRGLGALAGLGSGEHGGSLRPQPASSSARVYRLRDARSVQPDLGGAHVAPEAPRPPDPPRVRRVRGHALGHRLPVRREPAAPLESVEGLTPCSPKHPPRAERRGPSPSSLESPEEPSIWAWAS